MDCKPKVNGKYFILILSIIVVLGVFIFKFYSYQRIKVTASGTNIYNMDIKKDFMTIKNSIGKFDNLKLMNYQIDFLRNGKIKELNFELVRCSGHSFIKYNVQFNSSKNIYYIFQHKITSNNEINDLIDAERFFQMYGNLKLEHIIPTGDYESFCIMAWGKPNSFNDMSQNMFEIKDEKIINFKTSYSTINGYSFDAIGFDKSGNAFRNSKNPISYLYDLKN